MMDNCIFLKFKSEVNRTMGGAHFYLKASYCLDQPIGGSKVIISPSSFCILGWGKKDCRLSHSPDLSSSHCARLIRWRWQTFIVPSEKVADHWLKKKACEKTVQPEKWGCMCEWRRWKKEEPSVKEISRSEAEHLRMFSYSLTNRK